MLHPRLFIYGFLLVTFLLPQQAIAQAVRPNGKVLIKAIRITGNSAITDEELKPVVAPYVGKEMNLADLRKVANLITEEYRSRGYTLARAFVPRQEIREGVVEIRVLEGTVGKIIVEGNENYPTEFIEGAFARVVRDRAIKQRSLEKSLLLLNEYPDLKAGAVLRAGREPGSTDIVVRVEDKLPIHFSIDYDNFGSRLVARHLFGAQLDVGDVFFIPGSNLSGRIVNGFDPESLFYYRVSYRLPINNYGTHFSGYYSAGDFDVGKDLAVLNINGETESYGFSFTHPVVRTRFHNLAGEIGFDLKDTKLFLLRSKNSHDRLRIAKAGFNYDGIDSTGRSLISLYLFQGLGDLFGGMRDNDPLSSRQGGSGNNAADGFFTKGSLNLARFQRISESFGLLLRGSAQGSTRSLVVSEEITIGGPDSVRGYPIREFFGDEGYNVSAELRVSPLPNPYKESTQIVLFIDHGAVKVKDTAAGQESYSDLTGIGGGLRLSLPYLNFSFRFDVGYPVKPSKASTKDQPTYYLQASMRY